MSARECGAHLCLSLFRFENNEGIGIHDLCTQLNMHYISCSTSLS
jgi:hypothetical protein